MDVTAHGRMETIQTVGHWRPNSNGRVSRNCLVGHCKGIKLVMIQYHTAK
jgi:hypothetical protein